MKQYFPKFVFKYQLSLNTINAKADNNEYRDYFVNTIIYLPITVILDSDHYHCRQAIAHTMQDTHGATLYRYSVSDHVNQPVSPVIFVLEGRT